MNITEEQFTATVKALDSELPPGFVGKVVFDVGKKEIAWKVEPAGAVTREPRPSGLTGTDRRT